MPGQRPSSLGDIFGPRGALSGALPFFEYRPQQHELAQAAAEVFGRGGALLAEVGTGTGKTLGYLIPALLSGTRAVVSTGTKNLQEQIYHKDIPILRLLWPDLKAAYLKGRGNYLCPSRLDEALRKPYLPGGREAEFIARIADWAAGTDTGDRAELEWLADDDPLWMWISSEREACLGSRCPRLQDCFLARARRRASAADLVVLNHHLLLAEAALSEPGVGLLPEAGILVVDEAHLLEEVATRQLGIEVSSGQMSRFLSQASAVFPDKRARGGQKLVRRGFDLLNRLIASLPAEEGAFPLETLRGSEVLEGLHLLAPLLEEMGRLLGEGKEESQEVEYLRVWARELAGNIGFVRETANPEFIYWYERRGDAASFYASPVDVSRELPRILYSRFGAILLTSATLAVGGAFRYITGRLGLESPGELIAGSPFDYRRQAVLFVPADMPHPNTAGYPEAVARRAVPLLDLTQGRAFILCTSRRSLEIIQAYLRKETDYRVLRQGEAPRSVLLEDFRRGRRAVLVATTSFWQGVDVPGEALSAVIIDRLPFASPDDPVTGGRIAYIENRGGNPFMEYQLPSAVIMLKQGLGRLIRRKTDRGLLAVMDPRLLTQRYGKVFLSSLPAMEVISDQESLMRAYRSLGHGDG